MLTPADGSSTKKGTDAPRRRRSGGTHACESMVHHEPTDPTQGIVTIMTRVHKAADILILEFQRTGPIAMRGAHYRGQDRGPQSVAV
jgi:hypothetical protein